MIYKCFRELFSNSSFFLPEHRAKDWFRQKAYDIISLRKEVGK